MKEFIAYALVVVGIPNFAGIVIGSIVVIPVARLLLRSTDIRLTNLLFLEIFNGLAASVAAALLFRLFGLTPGLTVPIIMAAWMTLYFWGYGQPLRAWISWLAGLFIGWFTLAQMLIPQGKFINGDL